MMRVDYRTPVVKTVADIRRYNANRLRHYVPGNLCGEPAHLLSYFHEIDTLLVEIDRLRAWLIVAVWAIVVAILVMAAYVVALHRLSVAPRNVISSITLDQLHRKDTPP